MMLRLQNATSIHSALSNKTVRTVGVVVIGVTVAPEFCHLAEVGMGVVDVEVALRCVAAVEYADNEA